MKLRDDAPGDRGGGRIYLTTPGAPDDVWGLHIEGEAHPRIIITPDSGGIPIIYWGNGAVYPANIYGGGGGGSASIKEEGALVSAAPTSIDYQGAGSTAYLIGGTAVGVYIPGSTTGTLAGRPAAAVSNGGALYYATDVKIAYISNGVAWTTIQELGEANTTSNSGTGAGTLALAKVGVDLPFKTIKAGANITITNNAADVTIAASAGSALTVKDEGTTVDAATTQINATGAGVVASTAGAGLITLTIAGTDKGTLAARPAAATANANMLYYATDTTTLYFSDGAAWTTLLLGEINTASNLGAGTGVWVSKVGVDLRFKSLLAGTGITLSSTANDITITSTASSSAWTVVTKVAAYNAVAGDFVKADASAGTFAVTLPTAVGISGQSIVVKKTDSSVNAVTVNTTTAQTMDTLASGAVAITTQYVAIVFVSDGVNWQII